MTLTAEQLELRRKGITATDAAKILGSSPWGAPIDVVLDKLGDAIEFVETDRIKWGNILEGPIRDDFAQRHGVEVTLPGTLTHSNGWAMATPDGIVMRNGEAIAGLEIKTHSTRMNHHYGEPGTDEVPPWVYVQSAWNIYVARDVLGESIDKWWVVVFMDGVPTDYVIQRDAELEERMAEQCRAFYVKHIVERVPVEPDGSESYGKFLLRRHPADTKPLLEADASILQTIISVKAARAIVKSAEKNLEEHEQALKLAIGDHEGISFIDDGKPEKITWKKSKPSKVTDWRGAFTGLAVHLDIDPALGDAVVEQFTGERDGSRRFVLPRTWSAK